MKTKTFLASAAAIVCALATMAAPAQNGDDKLDRTNLPIPEPDYPRETKLDARDAKAPPRFEVKAPKGAPNVIIFLIDDIGFGHSSAFGGLIPMPTLDRLASQGLKYNRFHTTALCSPTRVAMLTGRNHHSNNAGMIMEVATAFPGQTGVRPQSVTPMAEILRQNGYSTSAFGKYHETAPWEVSVSGPFDRWPTRSGFDKFYGFIGGDRTAADLRRGQRPHRGDIAMLRYSQSSKHPSLQLLVNHDDADREFAYAEKDGGSLKAAKEHGWTVVNIKDDWKEIFSFKK